MLIVFQRGSRSRAVGEGVGDQPHRRPRREDEGPPRGVLLEDVVLDRPAELLGGDPLALGGELVEEQQDRRRGVDRHRGGDPVLGDAVDQHLHVGERVDGHAHLADLAAGHGVVAVVAHLGGQVEGGAQPGLAGAEQVVEALVGLLGAAEAGVLPHRPQPRAVAVVAHPADVGEVARRRRLRGRPRGTTGRAGRPLSVSRGAAPLSELTGGVRRRPGRPGRAR